MSVALICCDETNTKEGKVQYPTLGLRVERERGKRLYTSKKQEAIKGVKIKERAQKKRMLLVYYFPKRPSAPPPIIM